MKKTLLFLSIISVLLALSSIIALCSCLVYDETYAPVGGETGSDAESTEEQTAAKPQRPSFAPETPYEYAAQMQPIWTGDTVYDESVMFLGTNDEVPLLYYATEIISVTSYDKRITYQNGVDYQLVDGKLVMPAGSKLKYIPESTYWSISGWYDVVTLRDGQPSYTWNGPGDTVTKYQVLVTYRHNDTFPFEIPDCSEQFENVIKKLEKGENVTLMFYGDSITNGWESSLRCGLSPNFPMWSALLAQYLAHNYSYKVEYVQTTANGAFNYPKASDTYGNRGTIYYINTAVGAWKAEDGYSNLSTHIKTYMDQYGCDILFYAYGMNNKSTLTSTFISEVRRTVEELNRYSPSTKYVLVSSMYPNNEDTRGMGNVPEQEEALKTLVNELNTSGITAALSPLQSVHKRLCEVKRFRDHSGNNMNHPNDYTQRVYAQVALQTILGYAN